MEELPSDFNVRKFKQEFIFEQRKDLLDKIDILKVKNDYIKYKKILIKYSHNLTATQSQLKV
jgi:hypothetical protein